MLIDELGRGTSSFDGMSIAEAVLSFLLKEVGSAILFSTHYSSITEQLISHPEV